MSNIEEFAKQMRELESKFGNDPETFHSKADDLMCDLLRFLGYGEGVDVFDKMDKWYA